MVDGDSGMDRRSVLKYAGTAGAVALAGCAGGGGDDTVDSVGVTMGQMDSGLDPQDHAETNTDIIVSQAYEGLMGRDQEGAIVESLATEWERVEPGTVRFTLRDDVTFHNGDDLTAEDVRFSIRRIENPDVGIDGPQKGDLVGAGSLAGVEAGDGEVTVNFEGLNPIAFQLFATNGQIMQQSWVEENGSDFINQNMNGTGPFQLSSYESGDEVVVERYEDYWDDTAAVEEVSLTASSESSTRVNQLVSGEADIVTNVPPQEVSRVEGDDGASIESVASTRVIFLQMRYDVEPFSDPQFRRAMNYAVDNQGIVENVLNGFGTPVGQPTLEQFTGHNPDTELYPHDPERAEELVEESGFAGASITLQTPIGRYLKDVEVAQAAADDMDSLSNVNCELQQREFNSLVQDVTAPNIEDRPQFTLLGWGNGEFDASQTIIPLLTSDGPLTVLENDEIDGLIADAQAESDPEARESTLQETNQRLHDLAPWVFLHQQFSVYGVSNDIEWEPRADELIDPYRASSN